MKTDNMYVKYISETNKTQINGLFYAVKSARLIDGLGTFPFELQVETEAPGELIEVWMPRSMKNGDISISGSYELIVCEDANYKLHGMAFETYNPEPSKPLAEVIDDLIKKSFNPGGSAYHHYQMLKAGPDNNFIPDTLIGKNRILHANCTFEVRDDAGNARVRMGSIEPTEREVNKKVRKALRCPEGADIVAWAEILAAGYFGEKHPKGGAIEDAIHYNKNGAYSDRALEKILAAIVNDGTKS